MESNEALERLCQTYWYPLYAYARRFGFGTEEAKDLTQEFFAQLLARHFPAGVKPEGGRFRSYLLKALSHFLTSEWRRASAEKRGGGTSALSLDALDPESRYELEPISKRHSRDALRTALGSSGDRASPQTASPPVRRRWPR